MLDIPRQTNITRDNASIGIDFLVYMRVDINNAEKAVLEVEDYAQAVAGLATTTLRAVVGDITLDDVLSQRDRINELIRTRLDSETERWGIKVTNVEIREIDPPREIQEAMNRQMSAERVRRAVILEADGTRRGEHQGRRRPEAGRDPQGRGRPAGRRAARLRASRRHSRRSPAWPKDIDANTMGLQYLDTLQTLGQSPSSKFIFPMEFTNLIGTIARARTATPDGPTRSASPGNDDEEHPR